MFLKNNIKTIALSGVVLILALTVWPTIYRYDKIDQKWPVRINRITGYTDILYPSGWQNLAASQPLSDGASSFITKQSEMISIDTNKVKINDVEVKVNWNFQNGLVSGEVVNTSKSSITLSTMDFTVYDSNGTVSPQQLNGNIFYSSKLNPGESEPYSIPLPKNSTYGGYKVKLSYSND